VFHLMPESMVCRVDPLPSALFNAKLCFNLPSLRQQRLHESRPVACANGQDTVVKIIHGLM